MKALPEGQYINHSQYGLGVILESDAERTSIDFDQHGLKKFVTSMMVVELSDLTPPTRKRARAKKTTAGKKAAPAKKVAAKKS